MNNEAFRAFLVINQQQRSTEKSTKEMIAREAG
jgi:hypothetical protein